MQRLPIRRALEMVPAVDDGDQLADSLYLAAELERRVSKAMERPWARGVIAASEREAARLLAAEAQEGVEEAA